MLEIYVIILHGKMVINVVNYKDMTVQELIDKLNSFNDKELDVCFPPEYGTDVENLIKVGDVFDSGVCVILSESKV